MRTVGYENGRLNNLHGSNSCSFVDLIQNVVMSEELEHSIEHAVIEITRNELLDGSTRRASHF